MARKKKVERFWNKRRTAVAIMALLLFMNASYVIVNAEILNPEEETNAAILGYDFAIRQLITEVAKCEPVTATAGGVNTTIIGIHCLGEN